MKTVTQPRFSPQNGCDELYLPLLAFNGANNVEEGDERDSVDEENRCCATTRYHFRREQAPIFGSHHIIPHSGMSTGFCGIMTAVVCSNQHAGSIAEQIIQVLTIFIAADFLLPGLAPDRSGKGLDTGVQPLEPLPVPLQAHFRTDHGQLLDRKCFREIQALWEYKHSAGGRQPGNG